MAVASRNCDIGVRMPTNFLTNWQIKWRQCSSLERNFENKKNEHIIPTMPISTTKSLQTNKKNIDILLHCLTKNKFIN